MLLRSASRLRLPALAVVAFTMAAGTATASTDTTEPAPAATGDPTATEAAPAASDPASAFPVTVEHKFGSITIESEPQRVVSIGFGEHDGLLALGVEPIAVREWYGEFPYATWPWAQDELGDATPEVLPSTELNFEQIAALDPDLIVGVNAGVTESDYAALEQIAPTLLQPAGYDDYATPWDVALEQTGRAVGKESEAAEVIASIEARYEQIRAEHPEFEGASAAVGFVYEDQPGAYSPADPRSQVLEAIGFDVPDEFTELAGDSFFFSTSQEDLTPLDTDVLIWVGSAELELDAVRAMPLHDSMRAVAEGREIFADQALSGAFSHASPLSIDYVLDRLVPALALAVDGDPATEVVVPDDELAMDPTTVTDPDAEQGSSGATAATGTAGDVAFDADQQAAADAWALVFDSTVGFDDKAAHLADADALQATVESYTTAGEAMGGIALVPTAVTVEGASATVIYDVMFGDAPAYTALDGTIDLVDGTWVVSRDEFCGFMASARNACPA